MSYSPEDGLYKQVWRNVPANTPCFKAMIIVFMIFLLTRLLNGECIGAVTISPAYSNSTSLSTCGPALLDLTNHVAVPSHAMIGGFRLTKVWLFGYINISPSSELIANIKCWSILLNFKNTKCLTLFYIQTLELQLNVFEFFYDIHCFSYRLPQHWMRWFQISIIFTLQRKSNICHFTVKR